MSAFDRFMKGFAVTLMLLCVGTLGWLFVDFAVREPSQAVVLVVVLAVMALASWVIGGLVGKQEL